MSFIKEPGKNLGSIKIFTLSTCIWCKKTKNLLKSLEVEFEYADMDLLSAEEKQERLDEIKRWNPACSYPTLVINERECIVGYDEAHIRKILGL